MFRVTTKFRFEEPVEKFYVDKESALAEVIRFTSHFKLGDDPDEDLGVTEDENGNLTIQLWTKLDGHDELVYMVGLELA